MRLFESLDPSSVLITPNQRLSAWVRAQYQQHQQASGHTVWPSIQILPFDNWLQAQYQEALASGAMQARLLTDFQSLRLWQTCLAKQDAPLLHRQQLAKAFQSTYKLAIAWEVPFEDARFLQGTESQIFLHTLQAYETQLAQDNLIDNAQLLKALHPFLLTQNTPLVFLGFAEFHRAQQTLMQAYQAQGNTIVTDPLHHTQPKQRLRVAAESTQAELELLAHFCKTELNNNPQQHIACVIPTLNQCREQVESVFNRICPTQYNISAGNPLSDYPVITDALASLQLYQPYLPLPLISQLLTSPFLGFSETEFTQRQLFDGFLRDKNFLQLSRKFLIQLSEQHCPRFSSLLHATEAPTGKQALTVWAAYFNQCLQQLGWPGERELNSAEYQAVQRFHDRLDVFSTLDDRTYTLPQARQLLQALCQETPFQPQSHQEPIQILGHLEAAGLRFDILWMTGMSDQQWPAHTPANAFIPKSLQRELDMPHATPKRTLAFFDILAQQLFSACDTLICSYAATDNGMHFKPSHCIQAFTEHAIDIDITPTYSDQPCEPADNQGLPLRQRTMKGGTGFFKSQAACAFQAYAKHRLQASSLSETYYGLHPAERGIIVHHCLEKLWRQLKNSETLQQKTNEQLRDCIQSTVQQTLTHYHLTPALLSAESTRLETLLLDWLTFEKSRDPFCIDSVEQSSETTISGLTFNIRSDRIDKHSDGSLQVIDYKTKRVKASDWLSERLPEPQLPIYALSNPKVASIAFAQVRPESQRMVDSNKLDWLEQKNEWQTTLNGLAADIKAGTASVNPRDTLCCQQCDLQSLCRIHEAEVIDDD